MLLPPTAEHLLAPKGPITQTGPGLASRTRRGSRRRHATRSSGRRPSQNGTVSDAVSTVPLGKSPDALSTTRAPVVASSPVSSAMPFDAVDRERRRRPPHVPWPPCVAAAPRLSWCLGMCGVSGLSALGECRTGTVRASRLHRQQAAHAELKAPWLPATGRARYRTDYEVQQGRDQSDRDCSRAASLSRRPERPQGYRQEAASVPFESLRVEQFWKIPTCIERDSLVFKYRLARCLKHLFGSSNCQTRIFIDCLSESGQLLGQFGCVDGRDGIVDIP